MKKQICIITIFAILLSFNVMAHTGHHNDHKTLEFKIQKLDNNVKHQPLLEPGKSSIGVESGLVTKAKGEVGSKHSSKNYEEVLVVVSGKGKIVVGDKSYDLQRGDVVYIPPHHEHQLINKNSKSFEYIYVAAPTM